MEIHNKLENHVYLDSLKQEINKRAKAISLHAFEIGKLLYEVKYAVGHGNFDNWIAENLKFCKSTALNYMRVYRTCLGHPEILEFFKPTLLYEICSPRFPGKFRDYLLNDVTGVFELNKKQLLKVAIEWKKGKITIKSQEVQQLLKHQKHESEYIKYKRKLKSFKNILIEQKEEFNSLNEQKTIHPFLSEEDNEKNDKFLETEEMIQGFIHSVDQKIAELRPIE